MAFSIIDSSATITSGHKVTWFKLPTRFHVPAWYHMHDPHSPSQRFLQRAYIQVRQHMTTRHSCHQQIFRIQFALVAYMRIIGGQNKSGFSGIAYGMASFIRFQASWYLCLVAVPLCCDRVFMFFIHAAFIYKGNILSRESPLQWTDFFFLP